MRPCSSVDLLVGSPNAAMTLRLDMPVWTRSRTSASDGNVAVGRHPNTSAKMHNATPRPFIEKRTLGLVNHRAILHHHENRVTIPHVYLLGARYI
jgi:hypothetical protein